MEYPELNYRFNESHTGDEIWIPAEDPKNPSIFNRIELVSLLENIEENIQASLEVSKEKSLEATKPSK